MLNKYGLQDSQPVVTPAVSRNDDDDEAEEDASAEEHRTLRRIVGKCQFLAPRRPDIAFATNRLARSVAKPSKSDIIASKRLLRYLRGTMDLGLKMQVRNRVCTTLTVFADSDWAGDRPMRKSVPSWVIMLDGFLLSAGARTQSVVAQSSCEAEYIAATAATSEAKYIQALFSACGQHVDIDLQRLRHLDVRFLWLQQETAHKKVRISKVPWPENVEDANKTDVRLNSAARTWASQRFRSTCATQSYDTRAASVSQLMVQQRKLRDGFGMAAEPSGCADMYRCLRRFYPALLTPITRTLLTKLTRRTLWITSPGPQHCPRQSTGILAHQSNVDLHVVVFLGQVELREVSYTPCSPGELHMNFHAVQPRRNCTWIIRRMQWTVRRLGMNYTQPEVSVCHMTWAVVLVLFFSFLTIRTPNTVEGAAKSDLKVSRDQDTFEDVATSIQIFTSVSCRIPWVILVACVSESSCHWFQSSGQRLTHVRGSRLKTQEALKRKSISPLFCFVALHVSHVRLTSALRVTDRFTAFDHAYAIDVCKISIWHKRRKSTATKVRAKRKNDDQQYQGRSITCARVREVSRTNNNISATRNEGNQKKNPSSLGVVLQIQARVDVKIVPSAAQVTLVQKGDLSDIGLRVWNVDLDKRKRKNDTIATMEDTSTRCTNKKEIQKKKMASNMKIQKSDIEKEKEGQENSEGETQEGSSTDTDCDQDSEVCSAEDSDKDIDTAEIQQEDWIESMKRRTAAAEEEMRKAKIPCWNEMHRRMKWRLAMRIASLTKERWVRKAAEWNPGLSTQIKKCRAVGRPKKRWEDEVNDFLKPEETEATKGSDFKKQLHFDMGCKAKRQLGRKRWWIRGRRQKENVGIQWVRQSSSSKNNPL